MSTNSLPQLGSRNDQARAAELSLFEELPPEIQEAIVEYLPIDDYLRLRETSTYWSEWGRAPEFLQKQVRDSGRKETVRPEMPFAQNFGVLVRSIRQAERVNRRLGLGPAATYIFDSSLGSTGSLAWAPSKTRFLVTASTEGFLSVSKVKKAICPCLHLDEALRVELAEVERVAINRRGDVVAGLSCGTALVLSWSGDTEILPIQAHAASITDIAFSSDEQQFISSSKDHMAKVWKWGDFSTSKFLLSGHTSSVVSGRFSPDAKRAVTASRDKTARLWDLTSLTAVCTTILTHPEEISGAVFCPDGRRVATACLDGIARIWDPNSAAFPLRTFENLGSSLACLAYSLDGQHLVTGSTCGSVSVIDTRAVHRAVCGSTGFGVAVNALDFSPDGRFLAVATARFGIPIFDFDPQPPAALGYSQNRQKRLAKAAVAAKMTHIWSITKDIWLNYIGTIN